MKSMVAKETKGRKEGHAVPTSASLREVVAQFTRHP